MPEKMDLLLLFKDVVEFTFLSRGAHLDAFEKIANELKTTGSTNSSRTKYWKQGFMAEKLATLIVVYKIQSNLGLTRSSRHPGKMCALQKNLCRLNCVYEEKLENLLVDHRAAEEKAAKQQTLLRNHTKKALVHASRM